MWEKPIKLLKYLSKVKQYTTLQEPEYFQSPRLGYAYLHTHKLDKRIDFSLSDNFNEGEINPK